MDIYKTLLNDELGRGEKVAWVFRWILYALVSALSAIVFFIQGRPNGFYGMVLCAGVLTYNLLLTYFIKNKLYYAWIRYVSATIDVLGLTFYNAFDAYYNSSLVPVTTATLLLYPVIIFLTSLRLDRKLIIFSTLMSIASMNILYILESPHFDPVIAEKIVSSDILGQVYRTTYVLLCGFLMLFIPGTVERLLKSQQDIYENNVKNYELAHKDKLTGLGNRILFDEQIIQTHDIALKNNSKYAVIFIDLDGFKGVNDSYGHSIGDQVLSIISKRIISVKRHNDTICRIGGDEFVIIINNISETDIIKNLCFRILDSIKKPINIMNFTILLGASIGVAIFPDNGNSWENIIKSADKAMYKIKGSGKGGVLFCENDNDTLF
ncbi:MAG: GGDEF domain-containing protein [Bacillota bacterium]|nr:GGDEF domain-containing protein [Bacillota bacterium]